MEQSQRLLGEIDARSISNEKRISHLEETTAAIQEVAVSVKLLAQNMERMAEEQKEQGLRLKALEARPGERWNTMTKTIFTSAVSTISGGILGALVTLLFK